jgi:hypothetical protein
MIQLTAEQAARPIHHKEHLAALRAIIAHNKHQAKTEAEKIRAEKIEQGRLYFENASRDLRRIVLVATRLEGVTAETGADRLTDQQALDLYAVFRRMINFLKRELPEVA